MGQAAKQGRPALAPLRAAPAFDPQFEDQLDQMLMGAERRGWRHWALAGSFVLWVVLPVALAAWYLFARAAPRLHVDDFFKMMMMMLVLEFGEVTV